MLKNRPDLAWGFESVNRQGFDPKTGTVKKPLDKSNTASIMNAEAPKLGKQLNKYTNWLKSEFKDVDIPQLELLGEGLPDQSLKTLSVIFFLN